MQKYYKHDLKMNLKEVRHHIDALKQASLWQNIDTTNCYAYAIGLDVKEEEIIPFAYIPGVIGGSQTYLPSYRIFTYKQLIHNMELDFKSLGINFKEANPNKIISSDEWKIALFVSPYTKDEIDDYHFLKQNSAGVWYHKNGYNGNIVNYDNNHQTITNPEQSYFKGYEYKKCYTLKKKKINF